MSFNSLTEDLSLNSIYPCVSEHCTGKESSFEGENWARKAWSGNLWFLKVCVSHSKIYTLNIIIIKYETLQLFVYF